MKSNCTGKSLNTLGNTVYQGKDKQRTAVICKQLEGNSFLYLFILISAFQQSDRGLNGHQGQGGAAVPPVTPRSAQLESRSELEESGGHVRQSSRLNCDSDMASWWQRWHQRGFSKATLQQDPMERKMPASPRGIQIAVDQAIHGTQPLWHKLGTDRDCWKTRNTQ